MSKFYVCTQYDEYNAGINTGFVAQCGPTDYIDLGGVKKNSIDFVLIINSAYKNFYAWDRILIHEFGHALGIGTLWQQNPQYWLDGNDYPNTLIAYNPNNCFDIVSTSPTPTPTPTLTPIYII